MVVRVAVLGGDKGSGKTTVMLNLIERLTKKCANLKEVVKLTVTKKQRRSPSGESGSKGVGQRPSRIVPSRDLATKPKSGPRAPKGPRAHVCRRLFILGPYGEIHRQFHGTDALSNTVSTQIKPILSELHAEKARYFVIYEGLRLLTDPMFEFFEKMGIPFTIFILNTPAAKAKSNRKSRGIEQSERSIKQVETRIANVRKGEWKSKVRDVSTRLASTELARVALKYVKK
jgi:hypothetical protein